MTVELACSQESRNRHSLRFPEVNPTLNIYPGFSLHDELVFLVQASFTPMEALQTATLNPAKFLGLLDQLGTITAGKQADLVLLEANPLDGAVFMRGRYLDRAALDELLAHAKSAAND
jgi:imidazolonepropionase-like amidohydrolase